MILGVLGVLGVLGGLGEKDKAGGGASGTDTTRPPWRTTASPRRQPAIQHHPLRNYDGPNGGSGAPGG